MSFQQLVDWLEVADLSVYTNEQLTSALEAGLEDSDLYGPELTSELQNLLTELSAGSNSLARIQALRYRIPQCTPEPDGLRLEREMHLLAYTLRREQWRTEHYVSVENAARSADVSLLEDAIDSMRERLVDAWEPYMQMGVTSDEIVAESVVGHRLMVQGLRGWNEGLEELEAVIEGGDNVDGALFHIELGNRLLVAVQTVSA